MFANIEICAQTIWKNIDSNGNVVFSEKPMEGSKSGKHEIKKPVRIESREVVIINEPSGSSTKGDRGNNKEPLILPTRLPPLPN